MGLSSSMFAGVTGLMAHDEWMGVIGNNLSNTSTVGFKSASMRFEDFVSEDMSTAAGVSQVGRGVRVSSNYTNFAQGSFENTSESTDLAIGGKGFFVVRPQNAQTHFYERAGNFRFDENGYLTDPHKNIVQGWKVQLDKVTNTVKTVGSPTDIRLTSFESPPQPTSQVNMTLNLDSSPTAVEKSSNTTNPAFAMWSNWNYNPAKPEQAPLGDTQYTYQTTMKVYDKNGNPHNTTIFFDQVQDATFTNGSGGKKVWEYMVTVPPGDDLRHQGANGLTGMNTNAKRGVLMAGTLTFNAAGELEGMSAYTLQNTDTTAAPPDALSSWTRAEIGPKGYPVFTANFLGEDNASVTSGAPASDNVTEIGFNLGMRTTDIIGGTGGWKTASAANAGAVGSTFTNIPTFHSGTVKDAQSTTSYNTGSATLFQNQDGYSSGLLRSVDVDNDGVMMGRYTNGQVIPLYKLTLASFTSEFGLRREGSNLFSESRASGQAMTGQANTGVFGSIASHSLEQSNVDIAREMVDMILAQRGFQANSKTITTADSMLSEVIQLKR